MPIFLRKLYLYRNMTTWSHQSRKRCFSTNDLWSFSEFGKKIIFLQQNSPTNWHTNINLQVLSCNISNIVKQISRFSVVYSNILKCLYSLGESLMVKESSFVCCWIEVVIRFLSWDEGQLVLIAHVVLIYNTGHATASRNVEKHQCMESNWKLIHRKLYF